MGWFFYVLQLRLADLRANVHGCGQSGGRGPIGGTPGDFMGSLEYWRKHEGEKMQIQQHRIYF